MYPVYCKLFDLNLLKLHGLLPHRAKGSVSRVKNQCLRFLGILLAAILGGLQQDLPSEPQKQDEKPTKYIRHSSV